MKLKYIFFTAVFFLIIQFVMGYQLLQEFRFENLDVVNVNELMFQWIELIPQLEQGNQVKMPVSDYDYSVLAADGSLLYQQGSHREISVYHIIRQRDLCIDLVADDTQIGKLILANPMQEQLEEKQQYFLLWFSVQMIILVLVGLYYAFYLEKTIFRPFRRLNSFAVRIANGNLDIPLSMDQNNAFGAFTESFDLMRDELRKSREREHIATQSKKELIAKLSHDVNTPVASIKAVAEVLTITVPDLEVKEQLSIVTAKADQIHLLVSNLFQSTLEELQELTVVPVEENSQSLIHMLILADYQQMAQIGTMPECFVWFDKLRLQQVFDNIVGNSYKYANTKIEITGKLLSNELQICFCDHGVGVSDEESHLLFEKFFRGENGVGKSGTGLGLYISRYLMEQMGGSIYCEKEADGFCICVNLRFNLTNMRAIEGVK
jgi:signal transduction histidine kinase